MGITPYIVLGETQTYIDTAREYYNYMVVSGYTNDFSDEIYKHDSNLSFPDETEPKIRMNQRKIVFLVNRLFTKSGGSETEMNKIKLIHRFN